MPKFLALKPDKIKELLKVAKPVIKIFSAISSLKQKIEKAKNTKYKEIALEEVKKLKIELEKKEKELEKMGKKKVIEGSKAIRFLLHHNKHFVQYLAKGYSSFNRKIDPEELTSEGIFSLPKAIENFDLDSKNSLPTYSGYWIRQYIQTYLKKIQFINQGAKTEEKKNVVYYDNNYQNDDKENKSYSLLETLHDDENAELTAEQIRHRDAIIQTNNLINALKNREGIFLVRLLSKVKPSNLLDIYYLATEEEKKNLKKKMKLSDKSSLELLQKYSLEEKKNDSLPLVKKYLSFFTKNYNFSEVSKTLGKTENMTRRLKQESFKKMQKLAKERKLHLLLG